MSFPDALSTCLRKYATFAGRARRAEYWQFTLAYVVALVVAMLVDQVWDAPLLAALVTLGLLLPSVAVTVRRLHDTGRSGAWYLLALVPFGGLVLLVFTCQDSSPVANEYGPSPKHIAAHRAPVHA